MLTRSRILSLLLLAFLARPAFPATMSLVAVAKNGSPIDPTSGVVASPGDTVTVEVRLSAWAGDLPNGKLRVFEANLNALEATQSGTTGSVLPLNWNAPLSPAACQSAADCPAQFPICDIICKRCVAVGHQNAAGMSTDCNAPDHPFEGRPSICDAGGFCTLLARKNFGVLEEDGVIDPGGEATLGEFVLQVSIDAGGTFVFDLADFPKTFIGGTTLVPVAVSRIPLTLCTTPAAIDCNANLKPDECDLASGASPDENVNAAPDECDLDLDEDADVDLHDAAAMLNCFGSLSPACLLADFFPGAGINKADWSAFSQTMTGPQPPSDH